MKKSVPHTGNAQIKSLINLKISFPNHVRTEKNAFRIYIRKPVITLIAMEIIEIIKSVGVTRSLGAYIGLTIICAAIYAVVFFLILFVFGFFGIFTGTLGFAMAAGGIFVAGFFIAYFVMLFIVGPYTMIMQSRVSGLLYNLH